jgi:hypothetical protein
MNRAHLSLKQAFAGIPEAIAKLAGLEWTETLTLRAEATAPAELDRLDPFFDSIGSWDAGRREVIIDVGRCERKWPTHSANVLIEVAVTHFCARTVVQLGTHPRTGKQYIGWDAEAKRFAAERYPLRPNHRFYDELVREQQLFTQLFTYLHLLERNDDDEIAAFHRLSRGHCGLYELDYCGSSDAILIDHLLVHDWRLEAQADRAGTALKASRILGWHTRQVPLEKADILDWVE